MKWISSSIVYLLVSSLHKNEIIPKHSSFSISSSLKNEVGFLKHSLPFGFKLHKNEIIPKQSSHSVSSSLKNETDAPKQSSHSMSSSLKNEIAPDHHVSFS